MLKDRVVQVRIAGLEAGDYVGDVAFGRRSLCSLLHERELAVPAPRRSFAREEFRRAEVAAALLDAPRTSPSSTARRDQKIGERFT